MESKIVLDSEMCDLEFVVFVVDNRSYGINVTKIREILVYRDVVPVPNIDPNIEGIFMPRDDLIYVVDLKKYLHKIKSKESGLFIVTNFNRPTIAFHVDSAFGIWRISRKHIIKPDSAISSVENEISAGIIKANDGIITILNFEKIVSGLNLKASLEMPDSNNDKTKERSNVPIVIAENSPLLYRFIVDTLRKSGYDNLIYAENGEKAWGIIVKRNASETLSEHVKCVITGIEMPEMDGHRLTYLIKSNNELKNIPVIIFTSLLNEELEAKGRALGVDAQLSKPEIGHLVQVIDQLVL